MSGKDFYFMGISEIIGNKREEVLALAARYGASNVRIFGSVARGTADTDSDIDFLVDMEKGRSLLRFGGAVDGVTEAVRSRCRCHNCGGLTFPNSRKGSGSRGQIMRDDRERLIDIQQAIVAINKYAGKGRTTFEREELVQTWVVHHLQIIGEATSKISEGFQDKHPQIPWSKIIGMRNILVHDYFGIDIDIVWQVIKKDLPELAETINQLLQ